MKVQCVNKEFSSDTGFRMDKEYIYYNYEYIQSENSPVYGVKSASDIIIETLYYDELNYILNAEGTHVILFGGAWSTKTQAIMDRVNYYGRKHGAGIIHMFDFSADGQGEYSSIKADITKQADYDGPGKQTPSGCAECNFMYGEIVSRNLTNLNDWVKYKKGSENEITYLNLYDDAVSVPNLSEPFLFIYNKDYEGGPIVNALELDYEREELPADIDERFDTFFSCLDKKGLADAGYTHQDYLYDAFKCNERGHSFKTEDAFGKDEQINIIPVTLHELIWILSQQGSFMVMFCGAWCANSQACIATVNDFAVANNVYVYMIDSRLDGKYPIDFWYYPRQNDLYLSHPAVRESYLDLWERCLPGAPILCRINPFAAYRQFNPFVTDKEGNQHAVLGVDIPYVLAVNKDNGTLRGPKPVLAACNHDGFELINCSNTYIYYEPNYRKYTAGIYYVMNAYCDSIGKKAADIKINRTAPIAEGEPVQNPHIKGEVMYSKKHDWYSELSGRTGGCSADSCCLL